MTEEKKISLVLVDDSSVIRGALTRILNTDNSIDIVGSVSNGQMGVTMAKNKLPDVMILDVEMPIMDGLSALPEIMKVSPKTKVIMCSSLTAEGADTTIKAMTLGAVECIVKPSSAQETGPDSPFRNKLISLIRSLGGLPAVKSGAQGHQPTERVKREIPISTIGKSFTLKPRPPVPYPKPDIIAIGSSTGGPQALFTVLSQLKGMYCPIVITQHMPATFTKILANHITQQTGIEAHEGEDGMPVKSGTIYVAPGGKHMLFKKESGQLTIQLNDGPPENFCKPAVDPMLRSLIEIYGNRILCAILTGMGQDGLLGARILSEKGGRIIAQDEKTSVVWGMPGAVAVDGICSEVLPIDKIGSSIRAACD